MIAALAVIRACDVIVVPFVSRPNAVRAAPLPGTGPCDAPRPPGRCDVRLLARYPTPRSQLARRPVGLLAQRSLQPDAPTTRRPATARDEEPIERVLPQSPVGGESAQRTFPTGVPCETT